VKTNALRDRVTPTSPRRWRALPLNLYAYAALILVIFLGTVWAAQTAGVWATSGKVNANGQPVQVSGKDPSELKGWMTVNDVITAYNVPKDVFYAHFKLPASLPADTAMNQIEKLAPGFSVDAVRTWLAGGAKP
jgi:hypothetical protein